MNNNEVNLIENQDNKFRENKKNIFDILIYCFSISLILFSLIIYKWLKFNIIFVILFSIFITSDIYKFIKNKKLKIFLRILIPLTVLIVGTFFIYNDYKIARKEAEIENKKQLELQKDLSNWIGKYEYASEDKEGVFVIYNLEINKKNNKYYGNLEVIRNNKNYNYILSVDDISTSSNLILNFDSVIYSLENEFESGDYLFRIAKTDNSYYTYWVKNINGKFNDGYCFDKVDSFSNTMEKSYNYESGDVIYFYEIKYNDDNINYSVTTSNYKEVKNDYNTVKTIGSYVCESNNCNVFDFNADNYNVVIYDDDYFIFNVLNSRAGKILHIPNKFYNSIELVVKDSNNVGVILSTESLDYETSYLYDYAYFDIEKSKMIIDFGKYNNIYYDSNSLKNDLFYCSIGESYGDDFKSYLVDIKNGEIIQNEVSGSIGKDNNIYYYFGYEGEDLGIETLYDNKFNVIYKATESDDYLDSYSYNVYGDNSLIISDANKYYIYKNNVLVYTSDTYEAIYNVFDEYVAVNKDSYLMLIDYEGNIKSKMCEIKDKMYVHYMISGNYEDKGKKGIFMVVSDPNVNLNDIDEETRESFGVDESNFNDYKDMIGYEYYYVPETGETGKFPTIIGGYAKPVLYLYPTKDDTLVNVTFDKPKLLTTTYPKYINNWNIIVDKDGNITDKTGKNYYGLYWEEKGSTKIDYSTGFYVEKDNAIEFLEEKLKQIGLNERESNEFIMYWLPILEKNNKNLIYFELTEERQKYNKLNIFPKVDSLLRVSIHVKKVDKKVEIKPQKFNGFVRNGFTAVEWGGVLE